MSYPRLVRLQQHFERPRVDDVPRARPGRARSTQSGTCDPTRRHGRAHGGQPRHRQHPASSCESVAEFLKRPRRQAVHRARDGQPRRRHGRGAAQGPRKLRHHRGRSSAPHPRLDGRRLASAPRPRASPSSSTGTPREADHIGVVARVKPHTGYHGPIESGLHEDDDDRPGQARRRPRLSPHPARTAVRPGRALGRADVCGRRRPIAFGLAVVENAYDETARVDGGAARRLRAASRRNCWCMAKRLAGPAAVPRGRPAHRRRDRQGHQRLGHGHQRRRPQARLRDQPPRRTSRTCGSSSSAA